MSLITMAGLAGGGARALGPLVARELGADYVDRLILAEVAKHVGATVEALHQREERPPTKRERFARVLQRILERSAVTGAGGDPYFGPGIAGFLTEEYEDLPQPTITQGHELEDEKYITAIKKVMRVLASSGNAVLVGRGGHVICKDIPNILRVGVTARFEDRIAVIMNREKLDWAQAEATVRARDNARNYYFKRFFEIDDPDSSELFHVVINTSEMNLHYASEVVTRALYALQDGKLGTKVKTSVRL